MSKIKQVILKRTYEYIRDRIFAILMDEFDGQFVLTYDTDLEVNFFIERGTPIDKTELPAIVVSIAKGSFDNKNQGNIDGSYSFNIDCFTNAKTNITEGGDYIAAKHLQKIMGICISILEDPIYKTLGFTPPFIMSSSFSEMNFASPNKEDASNTSMGRLTFNIRANEAFKLIEPSLIEGYETTVQIGNSGKGYFYIGENY
jgi:hypothetical protein